MTDLGSQHGTHVNGHRLAPNTPRRLLPGDDICFGPLDLGGKHFKVGAIWGWEGWLRGPCAGALLAGSSRLAWPGLQPQLCPSCPSPCLAQVKMVHHSLVEGGQHGTYDRTRAVPPPRASAAGGTLAMK